MLHYIITKFQNHVKDMFFPLQKSSLKLIKRHYKHPQNSKSEIVRPFVVPEHYCRIKYKEMQTKYTKLAEEKKEPKLSDVKVSDITGAKNKGEDTGFSPNIKMPGMPTKPDETAKKPLIEVIDKKPLI